MSAFEGSSRGQRDDFDDDIVRMDQDEVSDLPCSSVCLNERMPELKIVHLPRTLLVQLLPPLVVLLEPLSLPEVVVRLEDLVEV
jgi:hypothetical protein